MSFVITSSVLSLSYCFHPSLVVFVLSLLPHRFYFIIIVFIFREVLLLSTSSFLFYCDYLFFYREVLLLSFYRDYLLVIASISLSLSHRFDFIAFASDRPLSLR